MADTAPNPPQPLAPEPKSTDATAAQPWWRRHRRWLIVAAVLLVSSSAGAAGWWLMRPKPSCACTPPKPPKVSASPSPSPSPTPNLKASPLTGVMVDPALAGRPIISVIVENHPDARPQSGLSQAGVVYETLAEGGITRFQTFFLDGQAPVIGPVRSLRPYFVDWSEGFGAPVAHAGGSSTALDLAASTGMKDLNALVIGAPRFYRTSDRIAPHNLYTSSALLDQLLALHGWNAPAAFSPLPRQADHPLASPTHPSIHIDFSYNGYQVDYKYDAAANDYARVLAGAPHIDRNTGAQLHVKNVVLEYTPISTQSDGHMLITTVGQGSGVLFRDGDAIPCTWKKDARTSMSHLFDSTGHEVALNAGNTWYEVVPTGKPASY